MNSKIAPVWCIKVAVLLVISAFSVLSCEKRVMKICGQVVNNSDLPIEGVRVWVGKRETSTNKEGTFCLEIPTKKETGKLKDRTTDQRFVLNMTKGGYSQFSGIYYNAIPKGKWRLTQGTVVKVDPRQTITVVNNVKDCYGSLSSRIDTAVSHLAAIPLVYRGASLVGFEYPDPLKESYQFSSQRECNTGARVTIPANSLVDPANNAPPADSLSVSVSMVDIYAPDGMPGDWTSRSGERLGFMESAGAVTVEVFDNRGNEFKLKKGTRAEIVLPIDPLVLKTVESLPETIPFFYYDEDEGIWEQDGVGKLSEDKTVYTATTSHFSVFNMDVNRTTPACLKVCLSNTVGGTAFSDFTLEVTVPTSTGGFKVKNLNMGTQPPTCNDATANGDCKDGVSYTIHNLPPQTPIGLRLFQGTEFKVTYVLYTGDENTNLDIYNRPICPYGECAGFDTKPLEVKNGDVYTPDPANPVPVLAVNGNELSWFYEFTTSVAGNRFTVEIDETPFPDDCDPGPLADATCCSPAGWMPANDSAGDVIPDIPQAANTNIYKVIVQLPASAQHFRVNVTDGGVTRTSVCRLATI